MSGLGVGERERLAPPAHPARLVGDLIYGYRGARLLFAGATLGVFDAVAARPLDLGALCRRLSTRPRPTRIFLDGLVAVGLLARRRGRYAPTDFSRRFLVPGGPDYLGDNLKYQDLLWDNWGRLPEVLRTGRVRRPLDVLLSEAGGPFVREYIRGMDNIAKRPAREVAARLPLPEGGRLLDVGAGPGRFARTLLERYPGTRADVLDLPATLKLTRRFLAAEAAAGRVRFLTGDYRKAPLEPRAYDAVLLSHVTHDEGERDCAGMIRRCARALKPGGVLAVHDFMLEDDRVRPAFTALFSVHMLVATRAGRVYARGEYARWMRAAGLRSLEAHAICPEAPNATVLLTGRRPG